MLLNFKVKNYLSFKDEAGFSMEANRKIKNRDTVNNKNIVKLKDGETIWLNKTAIFYGANASGKTNIFKGLDFLKYITLNSFKFDIEGGLNNLFLKPFLLEQNRQKENIIFEIEFLIEKEKYKYFIELNENEIFNEKLSLFQNSKEKIIINREKTKLFLEEYFFGFKEDEFVKNNLYPRNNQTSISKLSSFDSEGKYLATKIVKFFRGINFIDSNINLTGLTLKMLDNKVEKKKIIDFIKSADNNIENIEQEENEFDISKNNNIPFFEINGKRIIPEKVIETSFIHPVYENEKKVGNIGFNLEKQESLGTQKLFSLLGPILDTIKMNGILLIDEIDTHMHFLLVENLIKFFHGLDDEGRKFIGNSQFIFNTHNLDLMDLELFKKDQIYFTSKDYYGATEIFSLDDFKEIQIRNNSDIKKAYKVGAFGAIPILSEFNL